MFRSSISHAFSVLLTGATWVPARPRNIMQERQQLYPDVPWPDIFSTVKHCHFFVCIIPTVRAPLSLLHKCKQKETLWSFQVMGYDESNKVMVLSELKGTQDLCTLNGWPMKAPISSWVLTIRQATTCIHHRTISHLQSKTLKHTTSRVTTKNMYQKLVMTLDHEIWQTSNALSDFYYCTYPTTHYNPLHLISICALGILGCLLWLRVGVLNTKGSGWVTPRFMYFRRSNLGQSNCNQCLCIYIYIICLQLCTYNIDKCRL